VVRNDSAAEFSEEVVGVDLGIKTLATLSTGEVILNPRPLNRYARRITRLNRELSRRHKGSGRRARTKHKIAKTHSRVANLRRDATHKLTTALVCTYGTIVIEDLGVRGMSAKPKAVKNPDGTYAKNDAKRKAGLNRAIGDAGFGEIRRQIEYKAKWRGGSVVVADRFFPSSKTCSECGDAKAKLSLSERTYSCDNCDLKIDRDLNAALNLAAYGQAMVAGSGPETENARGGEHPRRSLTKSPVKREDGTGQPVQTVTATSQEVAA
jgi:putative transposase